MPESVEFDKEFRLWLADRLADFSQSLKDGNDPEVTFSAKLKGLPRVTCQIRLMDCPGVFTRDEFLVDLLKDGRN